MNACDSACDAAIVTQGDVSQVPFVVRGGSVMTRTVPDQMLSLAHFHRAVWDVPCNNANLVEENDAVKLWAIVRWRCPASTHSCPSKRKAQSQNELSYLRLRSWRCLRYQAPIKWNTRKHFRRQFGSQMVTAWCRVPLRESAECNVACGRKDEVFPNCMVRNRIADRCEILRSSLRFAKL